MAKSFFGGLHFDDKKSSTKDSPIEMLPPPEEIIIPMSMHIGAPCIPVVAVGDKVLKGQKIGDCEAAISAPIHASVSGTVKAIELRRHPNGDMVQSVVVQNDFNETWDESVRERDNAEQLSEEELIAVIREAGIVGLGGATFPTHFKISSGLGKADTVIVNGAECEPYLTSDHRLMLEAPEEIIGGLRILMKILKPKRAVIGIESNKKDAIEKLQGIAGTDSGIEVMKLRTRFPQGAEKQLIQAVTGRQVPSGGLPADAGCVVFNADTTAAVYRAVYKGIPVIRRIVTVSGDAVAEPKNLEVRIGTPLEAVFEAAGGFKKPADKVLMGGPMMGIAQFDLSVPVIKSTNGLLGLKDDLNTEKADVCIRCGRCVSACPMRLMPLRMYSSANKNEFETLRDIGLKDCMECGACTYICPGRLPLVHTFRMAKQKLAAKEKEGNK